MMLGREVFVNNNLQQDYSYKITHQQGNFSDLIGFTPTLSPLEMIEYGICGGVLFTDVVTDQEYLVDIRHLIFKRSARLENQMKQFLLEYGIDTINRY